ncbi:MAG: DUF4375 domain-containing protein [Pirellulaceae bacterium]|nr:DUF4375 domain-containing protein [Pirellulaceae bacterium]
MNYFYVLAAIVVGIIAYLVFKPGKRASGGFLDWVTQPSYQRAAADYFAARQALTVPDDISQEDIQKMIDRLFQQDDDDFNADRLKLVGIKAVPLLIAALENPQTAAAKFGAGGHACDAKSPFERIVRLLEPLAPAEAAKPLAPYVQHTDEHFRKYAANALGNIGTSEVIEPLLLALDDTDDYVRSFAMMGIQRGIKAERCTSEFLDAMFPAITKLLDRQDQSTSGRAPKLLLTMDAERAITTLLSPSYFNIANKQVHYILRALNAAGCTIPHETLLPFLNAVKPLSGQYPYEYSYAEALLAYARNPDASADELLRSELNSANEEVQAAAAKALSIMSGVSNAREVVFEALSKQGFENLAAAQKHYYAVFMYDAEVRNGGHTQYFVNSSGDHWQFALEGLKAIGAEARARILQAATEFFGTTGPAKGPTIGPATACGGRRRQLAALTKKQPTALGELDRQYYACDENIEALLAQYALKHSSHFVVQA